MVGRATSADFLCLAFYANDLPQRKYDPDQARSLMKKAGMLGTKIQYIASDAEEYARVRNSVPAGEAGK
jgi:hypothetical protein